VAVDIEERLDSSTLEVIGRHEPELQPTEVGTVLFSLKTPLAVDRYGENVRTGRFVIQDSLQIGGGGTIQTVEGDADSAVRRFSLDDFQVGADGARVVDLSLERNGVELDVTPGFLDHLSAGNRLIVRLRDPVQIEPVALLAYEHNLGFVFSRDRDRVNVVLYRERDGGAEARAAA